MIVERFTWNVKPGRAREFAELLKAQRDRSGDEGPTRRIYIAEVGPFNKVMWEGEFENDEQRQKYWADWRQQPETKELVEKMIELQDPGVSRELWRLV